MKIFIILSIFLSSINCSYSNPRELKGVLNDVSLDETKILYTCKEATNEAYSDGTLYVLDLKSNMATEVGKIKNMDYNIRSYFINNETVLVASYKGIFLYDLKTKSILKSVLKLDKQEALVSSRKLSSTYYYTLINYNDSKLSFVRIDSSELILKTIKSFPITIQPTDNFFDIFLLKECYFLLDNGKLHDESNLNNLNVGFNNKEGSFVIAANRSAICFIQQKNKSKQLKIISSKDLKLQSINLPIDTIEYLRVESVLQKGKEKFLVSIGDKSFLVDENGNYVKDTSKGVYYGKKIIIRRKDAFDTYEMEVLIMK